MNYVPKKKLKNRTTSNKLYIFKTTRRQKQFKIIIQLMKAPTIERTNTRERNKPSWHNDYDMSYMAFGSETETINNTPSNTPKDFYMTSKINLILKIGSKLLTMK